METPLQFLRRYQQIRVQYADPTTGSGSVMGEATVSLRRYLSAIDDPCHNKKKFPSADLQSKCVSDPEMAESRQEFLDFRDNHLRPKDRVLPHGESFGDERQAINRAFNGKGSPEDCALALQFAVEQQDCEPGEANVQAYCDDHLGLDCNGLVDRYFGRADSHLPSEYVAGNSVKLRNRLEEVEQGDCLVWCDKTGQVFAFPPNRHIALVERPIYFGLSWRPSHLKGFESSLDVAQFSFGRRIHVVESTGGLGPSESYYAVHAVKHDKRGRAMFQVFRPRKGTLSWVRIVPGLILEMRELKKSLAFLGKKATAATKGLSKSR